MSIKKIIDKKNKTPEEIALCEAKSEFGFEQDRLQKEFESIVEPLIEYMDNFHPHHTLIIDSVSAELLEGQCCHHTEKYLKD